MSDLLNMEKINSCGQLCALISRTWWPIYDIDIETGCLRIDVCGLLECKHIGDVTRFKDDDGNEYQPDDFYMPEDVTP